jgi:hypothetical protein
VHFKSKILSSSLKIALAYYSAGVVVVNSIVVGLAQGVNFNDHCFQQCIIPLYAVKLLHYFVKYFVLGWLKVE